jgi:hypothetical protein
MFLNIEIKEYNINIINLNYILNENIELELSNFLYNNNLKELSLKSRDLKKITTHFVLNEILNNYKLNYNNILIFNKTYNLKIMSSFFDENEYITYINNILVNLIEKFKLSYFEIQNSFVVDINTIYKLKQIIESNNKINYEKAKDYCKKTNLTFLEDKLTNNLKTKIILCK